MCAKEDRIIRQWGASGKRWLITRPSGILRFKAPKKKTENHLWGGATTERGQKEAPLKTKTLVLGKKKDSSSRAAVQTGENDFGGQALEIVGKAHINAHIKI